MFCKAMHNDSVNFIDYGWRNWQYKCPQYMPMRNIIPPTCCVVSILIPYRHIMVHRRESIDGNYHQSDSMFLYAIEPLYNKNILGKCSQKSSPVRASCGVSFMCSRSDLHTYTYYELIGNNAERFHAWLSILFSKSLSFYLVDDILKYTFFNICLKDASERSGLIPALRILFHTIAPWYLMPVWLRFAEQEVTWRWEAILVL